ncbi:unnamed protein product [Schistosoma margrebowiei]|uniref:Uncharacterized protein n=1 Tax=Schistosoma margrebowiei TaxID=48269 RepID=A0A183M1H0_9TREM|nr:unnamed protein product [Schistosoma margrebowiei]
MQNKILYKNFNILHLLMILLDLYYHLLYHQVKIIHIIHLRKEHLNQLKKFLVNTTILLVMLVEQVHLID